MGLQVVRPRRNASSVTQKTNAKIKTVEKRFAKNNETIVEKRKTKEIEKSLDHCVKMTSVARRQLPGSCNVAPPPKAAGLLRRGVKRCCSDQEIDSWFMGQDRKRAKFDSAAGLNKKDPIRQDLGSQEVVGARVSGQKARVVTVDDIIKQQANFLHHQPTKGNHASATQSSRPNPVPTPAECAKESRQRLRESSRLALDEMEKNSKPAFEDSRETMREMHMLMYGTRSHQQAAAEYDALGMDYRF